MCQSLTKNGKKCKNISTEKYCYMHTRNAIAEANENVIQKSQKGKGKIAYSNEKTIDKIIIDLSNLSNNRKIIHYLDYYTSEKIDQSITILKNRAIIKNPDEVLEQNLRDIVLFFSLVDDPAFSKDPFKKIFLDIIKFIKILEQVKILGDNYSIKKSSSKKSLEGKDLEKYYSSIAKRFYK